MKLSEISFNHFFLEVCEFASSAHMALFQPNRQKYYKLGHIYLAIGFENNNIMIEYCINTGKKPEGNWVEEFIKIAKAQSNSKLIFCTANNALHKYAKSIGAVKVESNPLFNEATDNTYTTYELDLR